MIQGYPRRATGFAQDVVALAVQVGELARDVRKVFLLISRVDTFTIKDNATAPLYIDVGRASAPEHVMVTQAEKTSTGDKDGNVSITWDWVAGQVKVTSFSSVTADAEYVFQFLVIGGQ